MVNQVYQETLGLTYEEAILEAQRCLNCVHKPCVTGCVAHNEIPSMIQAFLAGNGEEAKRISEAKTSYPEICGRVCYQDVQCEAVCVRMKQNAPVKIGLIERFIGDHYASVPLMPSKTQKKVAIMGSGPAGLACALELINQGIDVTIFERKDILGGVLKYGIPPYRLPNSIVDARIDQLKQKGVEFKTHTTLQTTEDLQNLLKQGYHSVFIGIGASQQNSSKIKGADLSMVIGWKTFLSIINIGESSFKEHFGHIKKICVVGGGNVAMDVCISARKFGIETHVVYRRTQALMPARPMEVTEALHLGVILHELSDPIKIVQQTDSLEVICKKTQLSYSDASDRGVIVDAEGEERIQCDMFVMAIGSTVRKLHFDGLNLDSSNRIIINENYETSIPNVYAAGDAVTGTQTVIHALSSGKLAAQKIASRLLGKV